MLATWASRHADPPGSSVTATVDALPAEGSSTGGNAVSAALALQAALDDDPVRRAAATAVGTRRSDVDTAVSVRHPDNSAIVSVTYSGPLDGPAAVRVVRAVVRAGVREVYAPALAAARARVSAADSAAAAADRAVTAFQTRTGVAAPDEHLRAVLDEQQRLTTQIAVAGPFGAATPALQARLAQTTAQAARLVPLVGPFAELVDARRGLVDARATAAASAASVAGRLTAATADGAIGLDGPVTGGRPTLRQSLVFAAAGGLAVAVLVLVGADVVRTRRRIVRR